MKGTATIRINDRWKHHGTAAIYIVLTSEPDEVVAWSLPVDNCAGVGGFAWLGEPARFREEFVLVK